MSKIQNQLKAILLTAGAEKLQSETRWNFTIADGESKIIPFYWQDKDTDGESNADFLLDTNRVANRVLWKSRCPGGYYHIAAYNGDTNGALLGFTWVTLTKHNVDLFDGVLDIQTYFDDTDSHVYSGIIQDTLKDDDVSRQFVPHIKYQPLAAKQMHFEEGIMPSGKKTAPWTTPYIKALMVSNLTPLTSSSVVFQVCQNFYQYSPGTSTSSRSVVLTQDS